MIELFSNELFTYILMPLLIFISRILDVSMGTLRVIYANKGIKKLASIIGFFEVLIWVLVITTIIDNLTNVYAYLAYAGGFALGTYL
jgi:uncharacterized protein YebE (UPF0316 family)